MRRDTNNTIPTLAQLRKHSSWVWIWCERCQHHAPMAYVPLNDPLGCQRIKRQVAALRTVHGVRPQGRDATASRMGR